MAEKRDFEWDYIKGFLLIMVILGHTSAAIGTFEKDAVLNYLSGFTVSFIMPFFLISTGYFLINPWKTIDSTYFKKKARRLLPPAILWGAIAGIFMVTARVLIRKEPWNSGLLKYLLHSIFSLWYLYATFVSALLIGLIKQWIPEKAETLSLVIILVISYFIPSDIWWFSFSLTFILTGYMLRKHHFVLTFLDNNKKYFIVSCVYLVSLIFFKYDYSVYAAGSNLLTNSHLIKQITIDLFRYTIGIMGSISVGWILHIIYKHVYYSSHDKILHHMSSKIIKAIVAVGQNSLEMYVTQFFVVEIIFHQIMNIVCGQSNVFTANPYICYFLWRNLFGLTLTYVVYETQKILKVIRLGRFLY